MAHSNKIMNAVHVQMNAKDVIIPQLAQNARMVISSMELNAIIIVQQDSWKILPTKLAILAVAIVAHAVLPQTVQYAILLYSLSMENVKQSVQIQHIP